jgi:Glycosyltransferase sugar-binding region containing DXD motif
MLVSVLSLALVGIRQSDMVVGRDGAAPDAAPGPWPGSSSHVGHRDGASLKEGHIVPQPPHEPRIGRRHRIPLLELVRTLEEAPADCEDRGLVYASDVVVIDVDVAGGESEHRRIVDASPEGTGRIDRTQSARRRKKKQQQQQHLQQLHRPRKIPKVIHVTTKSRCVTREFADNLRRWSEAFPDHSLLVHNDAAMDRLLASYETHGTSPLTTAFPHLTHALTCAKGGAGRSDLWRALLLWEYGGIYTDIDNGPGPRLNSSAIRDDDDAYFVIERSRILSQYFFASRARHPVMFFLAHVSLHRLLALNDVTLQIVSYVSGPGALRLAFCLFLSGQGPNPPHHKPDARCWNPLAGPRDDDEDDGIVYAGTDNFTVRVAGNWRDTNLWVDRDNIPDKHLLYQDMNMTQFREIPSVPSRHSCLHRLYDAAAAAAAAAEPHPT